MNWTRTNLEDDILWVPMEEADAEIERLRTEHEKLLAVQEAQQRELVIRTHNQTRHLEEVQKLRTEIAALQRLVQNDI